MGNGTVSVSDIADNAGILKTQLEASVQATLNTPMSMFAPTAVKTANYTAVVGDLVLVDATSGVQTTLLPNAPADKSRVGVMKVDSGANAVSINRSGTDSINASGTTLTSLQLQFHVQIFQYQASSGIWFVTSNSAPLTGLDARSDARVKTLTNTRITKQVTAIASSAAPTPVSTNTDLYSLTALAVGATFGAPTGTPVTGQELLLRIVDNGSAQTLAFNSGAGGYRFSSDLAAPTTTIAGKTLYMWLVYNSGASRWDCYRILNNF